MLQVLVHLLMKTVVVETKNKFIITSLYTFCWEAILGCYKKSITFKVQTPTILSWTEWTNWGNKIGNTTMQIKTRVKGKILLFFLHPPSKTAAVLQHLASYSLKGVNTLNKDLNLVVGQHSSYSLILMLRNRLCLPLIQLARHLWRSE